jgi:hypothetical protein
MLEVVNLPYEGVVVGLSQQWRSWYIHKSIISKVKNAEERKENTACYEQVQVPHAS